MTAERLAEVRRRLAEARSGLFPHEDPWDLLSELIDAYVPAANFVSSIREPVGDLTEALEELDRTEYGR